MPYIKIFTKEELKFSKQENDLVNSNAEVIKSLEKELEFLKQDLVNCTRQKCLAMVKIAAMVAILILILTYQL